MSSFMSYNTSDGSQSPLLANAPTTVGPFFTGIASKIAGSVISDQSGTLLVQQSMNWNPNPAITTNWDISQSFTVTGGTPVTIDIDVVGPVARAVFTNGATNQTYMRLFLRAFGNRAA
jgi:hypothetical protein